MGTTFDDNYRIANAVQAAQPRAQPNTTAVGGTDVGGDASGGVLKPGGALGWVPGLVSGAVSSWKAGSNPTGVAIPNYGNEGNRPQITADPSVLTARPAESSATEASGTPNQGSRAEREGATGSAVNPNAGPVSAAVTGGLPGGITRVGNEYSGSGKAPEGGMTTEQTNTYYGGQRMAQEAQQKTEEQNNRVASAAGQLANQRSYDADQAKTTGLRNAQVEAKYNPGRYGRTVLEAAQGRATAATTAANDAGTSAVTAGTNPNLVQQAALAHETALKGQAAAQGSQTQQQSLQKGAQELQLGGFGVKHAALLQDMAERLMTSQPGSPEYAHLSKLYAMATGKDASKLVVIPGGQETSPSGIPISKPSSLAYIEAGSTVPTILHTGQQAGAQPPADWMARAKAANPGMSDTELAANYKPK